MRGGLQTSGKCCGSRDKRARGRPCSTVTAWPSTCGSARSLVGGNAASGTSGAVTSRCLQNGHEILRLSATPVFGSRPAGLLDMPERQRLWSGVAPPSRTQTRDTWLRRPLVAQRLLCSLAPTLLPCAAALVSPAPATVEREGRNLVSNSGFERSLNGWRGDNAVLRWTPSGARDRGAVRVTGRTSTGRAFLYRSRRPVRRAVRGADYHARAFVRTTRRARIVCLRLRERRSRRTLGSKRACVRASRKWRAVDVTYRARARRGHIGVTVFTGSRARRPSIDADNVSVRRRFPNLASRVAWRGNYETGNFRQWSKVLEDGGNSAAIVRRPAAQGRYAARFVAGPSDGMTRIEVERPEDRYGRNVVYTWLMYVPRRTGLERRVSVVQFKNNTQSYNGGISITAGGRSLQLVTANRYTNPQTMAQRRHSLGFLPRGRWFGLRVRFAGTTTAGSASSRRGRIAMVAVHVPGSMSFRYAATP